ncbi:MAG: tRNA uridine-5-carboxymethylaminomethyl(34) synthesis enzyme MnmG [Candidatus Firestonebacteria bacterium]
MYKFSQKYDVVVVGAGHAGVEASLSAARMGCKTVLFTINLDTISQMSCNPAIGGLAKGHLVREIDALGGEMGKVTDKSGIQFRMLNTRKGPAVHSLRVQCDKKAYQFAMKYIVETQKNLDLKQEIIEKILVENGICVGVVSNIGTIYEGKTVIISPGTFLNGLIHIGEVSYAGGRNGDLSAEKLSYSIREIGFELGRLKTGTNPRVNRNTIDFSQTKVQSGDIEPIPFSSETEKIILEQVPCYIVYTNEETNRIIKENMHRSPLYSGRIKGVGPRYCPSIEDKVVRFPEKTRHQIFLEPEGLNTLEIYLNGLSTSLPYDVQLSLLRTIPALKNVEIMRPGYAIEYDFSPPYQIKHTLETKLVKNLYFAGQINGTSGYEEAAGQGLIAGINAGLRAKNKEEFVLDRTDGYIGVLIDDLVTKGTNEPYRMFTSCAEHRLVLRQDNADLRLTEKGYKIGLISEERYGKFLVKRKMIEEKLEILKKTFLSPKEMPVLTERISLDNFLKRPGIKYLDIEKFLPKEEVNDEKLIREVVEQVEIQVKYEGYIKRQNILIEKFEKMEKKKIPEDTDYKKIHSLSSEAIEKLTKIKPESIGQASRISGVTPSDINIILIYLKKHSA